MSDKSLRFLLFGEDKGAGGMFGALGVHASSMSGVVGNAFSKMGSVVGGELGSLITETADKLDILGEKASKGQKLMAGGAAIAGIGTALMMLGSGEQQATDQLKQAVTDAGASWDEYEAKIEGAVKTQENFGHSVEDTKAALQKLTQATNDPQKALDQMGLVANYAAAKHVSLADAAGMVAKVINGGGTKALKEFGVGVAALENPAKETAKAQLDLSKATEALNKAHAKYKDGSPQVIAATEKMKKAQDELAHANGAAARNADELQQRVDELGKKIDGQAAASVDNFAAKVGIVKTKLGDWAAATAGVVGPAITALGPIMMVAGAAMEILTARKAAAAAADAALIVATEGEVVATETATVAQNGLNVSLLANPIGLVVLAIAGLIAAVVLAYNHVDWFKTGVDKALSFVKVAFGWISDAAGAAFGFIRDHWQLILAILTGPFGLAVLFISTHFDAIKTGVGKLVTGIGTALGGIYNVITWPFKAAFNAVADLWNGTLGKISFAVPSWVPGFGGKGFTFPQMPHLAAGGTLTSGGSVLVGENGPEIMNLPGGASVVPLGRGGSGGLTVNVTVQGIVSGSAMEVGRYVATAIQNARLQGITV